MGFWGKSRGNGGVSGVLTWLLDGVSVLLAHALYSLYLFLNKKKKYKKKKTQITALFPLRLSSMPLNE